MSHSASNQLLISRNKHLPYIASYHGPWLSLPVDLLQSLLLLNAETALPPRTNDLSVPTAQINGDAPGAAAAVVKQKDSGANKVPTSPAAPPLDPVIFRSLVAIRKLVDDASELVSLNQGTFACHQPLANVECRSLR